MDSLSPATCLPGGHTAMADLVGDWMRKKGLGFVEERKSNIESGKKYVAFNSHFTSAAATTIHSRCAHSSLSPSRSLSLSLFLSLSLSRSPPET